MTVLLFPQRQTPYFVDTRAVINFARSMYNVGILSEHHRLELVTLLMTSEECSSAEALEALANLMGQHG